MERKRILVSGSFARMIKSAAAEEGVSTIRFTDCLAKKGSLEDEFKEADWVKNAKKKKFEWTI